jgi:hypothetical protein
MFSSSSSSSSSSISPILDETQTKVSFPFLISTAEISSSLFEELAKNANASTKTATLFNETEKNFIDNVLNKAIVTPDISGTAVKIHVMDVDFFVSLDKKEFFNSFVLGSAVPKTVEQKIADVLFQVIRRFLMWVSESMVPNLFKYEVVSKLSVFETILKHVRAIEDEWRRSVWQNKYYYTSVMYKDNGVWTVHIAKYMDFSDSSSQQQKQPFVSCRFSNNCQEVEFWNHKNMNSRVTLTGKAFNYSALSVLVNSDQFVQMLKDINAFEGGDVNLLSIILLYKMITSKKNFSSSSSSSSSSSLSSSSSFNQHSHWNSGNSGNWNKFSNKEKVAAESTKEEESKSLIESDAALARELQESEIPESKVTRSPTSAFNEWTQVKTGGNRKKPVQKTTTASSAPSTAITDSFSITALARKNTYADRVKK